MKPFNFICILLVMMAALLQPFKTNAQRTQVRNQVERGYAKKIC